MKTEIQRGIVLTLIAPYALTNTATAAAGFKVGSAIGVAVASAANGASFQGALEGTFQVTSDTGAAWTAGDLIYWDNTNKYFTKTSTSNSKCGIAGADKASGTALGIVRLVPTI
jgi:predicted RecA/RadA family phage recombinase